MQHPLMKIKNLQLFIHLCKSQSLIQTAQENHISPSALTRIIQKVENEFQQPLFIRNNRHVELPNKGKSHASKFYRS